MLYAWHPLHRPISGYANTVLSDHTEDVVAFHQRFDVANNAIVVMVGDIPDTPKVIERYLGAWPAPLLEPTGALPQPVPTTGNRCTVDMEVNSELCSSALVGLPRRPLCCYPCHELHPWRRVRVALDGFDSEYRGWPTLSFGSSQGTCSQASSQLSYRPASPRPHKR